MVREVPGTGEFGCAACWPPTADAAWNACDALTGARALVEESHLSVTLRICPACAQQFVSVFVEEIDWVDGDDPQWWSMMPITDAEADELSRQDEPSVAAGLRSLGLDRRALLRECPKGEPISVRWGRGLTIF